MNRIPLPQYVAMLGDLQGANGPAGRGAQAVRADRRHPAAARRQRRRDRPRDGALRRRPRHPAAGLARARAARAAGAAVDRRGRRPGLGARANRPLRRGAALLQARPPARHARCAQVLPPRRDRALPRSPGRSQELVRPRADAEPALLGAVGACGEEGAAMKRLVLLLAVAAALLGPAAASAHPLGNFTINRFSRVEVSGQRLYVLYVLDLAEIPTFQAGRIDGAAYARRIASNAHLTVSGRPVRLVPLGQALAHPPGAGGLRTTRLEVVLAGPRLSRPARLAYHDSNYAGRIGWKEIVVGSGTREPQRRAPRLPGGHALEPARRDLGDGAGRTPPRPDVAARALDRREPAGSGPHRGLRLRLARRPLAAEPARDPRLAGGRALLGRRARALARPRQDDRHRLPRRPARNATACRPARVDRDGHAHDRRLRARPRDARALAVHRPRPPLPVAEPRSRGSSSSASARRCLRTRWRHSRHHHHHHHHGEAGTSLRSLFAVGVSGGLLPCPSALVVLLAAISLHRVAFGLLLILAFSAGLALTITGIGLAAVLARSAFRRVSLRGAAWCGCSPRQALW